MNISKVSSTKKLKEDLQLARPKNSKIEYEMEWERFYLLKWEEVGNPRSKAECQVESSKV